MILLAPNAALTAYRAGRHDEALSLAERILRRDPNAAEAHICAALIHFHGNASAECVDALKKAAAARSADWALWAFRTDLALRGRPPMGRDMGLRLGAALRSALGPLGPALPPAARRATHPFVNVVGTSYVRSFGGNPAFFPLFMGMGPSTLLLTEAAAVITRRKLEENLQRVDATRDTVIILGSDAYYHATDLLKTRVELSENANPHDLACMDRVAERHEDLLRDVRKIIKGRVFLVCSTPTQSALMTQLAKRLNLGLRTVCERIGVTFLDWWDVLADPETQLLRSEYCVNAYPGDVHFTLEATSLFIDLLKQEGVFDDRVKSEAAFNWTHVFECEISRNERTRIWCEPSVTPNNAFKSHKIAAAHLAQRGADLIVAMASQTPEPRIGLVNVRDAYLATLIPASIQCGSVAFTDTADNLKVGQMVLDFYGRSDVELLRLEDPQTQTVLDQGFDIVALCIHPDTTEADELRCNEVLGRVAKAAELLILTPFPSRLDRLNLRGRSVVATVPLPNRHIPEIWREFVVAVAR